MWIRFFLTASLLALSVFSFASAVLGTSRFGFILNRIHAAGIGDTLGLLSATVAVMIGTGEVAVILKLFLILIFMWCTSPVSAHFLGQIEYDRNHHLEEYLTQEDAHDAP